MKKKLIKQDKKYTEHLAEVTGELKRIKLSFDLPQISFKIKNAVHKIQAALTWTISEQTYKEIGT